ncbi:MAG: polysaccharide biosynthesis protein [Planctomycetota bacterium]|jgi:UDP-glucose 4-epimerase|nr:polysaccharide biosynthesis protein [Planctomycetota bacterium]
MTRDSPFDGKTILITGGTGSFGNAVVKRFLHTGVKEIRVFSRDEKKQDDMRRFYRNAKLTFHLGDVRNRDSISGPMRGVDCVFNAAALKQVPSCEFFPMEAVFTNILGVDNVLAAAIEAGVGKAVCLSTDKAAYPVNAMGISKAMMERVLVAKSRVTSETVICGTRYGNVMCSRGSVIPLFVTQIETGQALTVTDPEMTRFLMSLDSAVDLVLFAFRHAAPGDIMVQKAPACAIGTLARAVKEIFGADNPVVRIGTRHGEKKCETLLTREECLHAEDMGGFYRIPADNRDLNYAQYFEKGVMEKTELTEFNSDNALRLSVDEVKEALLGLEYIQEKLSQCES